ncbi:hypothetical protein [Paenibacillus ferrarius]|uniref:hypothetical protein n=1 Tax=Paenibacillus ferrarius TaxID=1469647 RepID=UPI003D2690E5
MERKVEETLRACIQHWNAMASADEEDQEGAADHFQSSFYIWIEAVREWVQGMQSAPESLDAFMALPDVEEIMDLLPAPLHLNFETEAELILEDFIREDEDRYD